MKIRKGMALSLWGIFCCTAHGHAALNDVAVFAPGVKNWMTAQQQKELATYLKAPGLRPRTSEQPAIGNNKGISGDKSDEFTAPGRRTQVYNYANQEDLVAWMNQRMSDGKSDVLLIIDLAPSQIFNDNDNSLAEAWMDNGNMLIWTGSEPFRSSVDAGGMVTDLAADGVNDGANKVLDIKGEGLCTGYASVPQQETGVATAASGFYDYLPSLNLNYTGPDMRSLSYVDVLTEAENVATSDDAPQMVIDEMFAENSDLQDTAHVYESDALVLTMRQTENDRKGQGGQYAQFYCYKGLVDGVDSNEYRKPVLYEFLHNWVARDVDLIHVQAGAVNGDGSEAKPYGTIQAGINAADAFSRDRVIVLPGTYNENITLKGSVKLISAGDDVRGTAVGSLDDFNNPELTLTYNTFPQVNSKKGLGRAQGAIIDGTGLSANKSLVHLPQGATLGTWIDGFTIQNMPTVDQTVCGHAQAIQSQGASPLFIDNIIQNNGSAGFGASATFATNSSGVSVEDDICQNNDFRYDNVAHNAHPALINNIIGANDGPNLSDDYYAYSIMHHNESFKSGYFGDDLPEPLYDAPGIRAQHGAHPYVYNNAVYDSSGAGIDARRGVNELTWQNKVDRPTRPVILDNYVLNSGTSTRQDSKAGIGALNSGGHDSYSGQNLYQIIDGNFIHTAAQGAIGCLYNENEDGGTTTISQNSVGYVTISNNTGTKAGTAGIEIHGCANVVEISHNEMTANIRAGIGIKDDAGIGNIASNYLSSNGLAGIGMKAGVQVAAIINNRIRNNKRAGIGHLGYNADTSENKVVVGEESNNIIEWNGAAGIGIDNSEVTLISMNTIRYNFSPGITVINSNVDLIEGSASTEGPERLTDNGRGDLHGAASYAAGLVVHGEGASANISNLIVEGSGRVNVEIGAGTVVTMERSIIRSNHHDGPNVHVTGDAKISNCLLEDSVSPGLIVEGTQATIALDDSIVKDSGLIGVGLVYCTITSFRGNTITGSGTVGITGLPGSDFHIDNCSILDSAYPGMVMDNMDHNLTISDSYFSGNGIGAIKVGDSPFIDIYDTVIHNENGGITVIDDTPERPSIVKVTNCDLDHPESGVQVDGANTVTITDSKITAIMMGNIDSFTLTGSSITPGVVTGIEMNDVGWADIIGNKLGGRWPILMHNSSGNVINNISALDSDGFGFDHSTVNFFNNTLFAGDSIWVPGGAPDDPNTFGLNAKNDSIVYAYNNIITGAQSCVSSQENSIVHADNNAFWGCRREFFTSTGGTIDKGNKNLLDVDPQLIDPLNGDYHLSADSPCIDAGMSDLGVDEDIEGDSRPIGAGSDIGADEAR